MKRLGSPQDCSESLDAGPRYVIKGILLGQTPSRCLAMSPQGHRFGIFWLERLNDLCPEQARCPHLGNLHKKIHADPPKEGYPWSKVINCNSRFQSGPDI